MTRVKICGLTREEDVDAVVDAGADAEGAVAIAPGGFEPPFSDPKSDVLPLDEGAAVLPLLNLRGSGQGWE